MTRLPETFSAGYLDNQVDRLRGVQHLVIVLGDSVLWGYKLHGDEIATARVAPDLPGLRLVNLSFEGGGPVNSEFMLRYLLARGVRPELIVFNVNLKEFNPLDSAYKRLRPTLQLAGTPILNSTDRKELDLLEGDDFNLRATRFIERYWLLYRYRVDLRQRLFGAEDFSSWLTGVVQHFTGYTKRYDAGNEPTPDRFLGTYDLSRLNRSNIAYARQLLLCDLARRNGIRMLAILTPTNHVLLHDYIDNSDYANNLATVSRALKKRGAIVLDLDRRFSSNEFLDNDHLNPAGNKRLAELLRAPIEQAAR